MDVKCVDEWLVGRFRHRPETVSSFRVISATLWTQLTRPLKLGASFTFMTMQVLQLRTFVVPIMAALNLEFFPTGGWQVTGRDE